MAKESAAPAVAYVRAGAVSPGRTSADRATARAHPFSTIGRALAALSAARRTL